MKTEFWVTGKTSEKALADLIGHYEKRIKNYIPFTVKTLRTVKEKSPSAMLSGEKEQILKNLEPGDYLVILDEKGKNFTSREFAAFTQQLFNSVNSKLIFLIGGPFGFHPAIKERANEMIALSKMTFTHDMVRLIFLEQLYRGLTIINNEPYHH